MSNDFWKHQQNGNNPPQDNGAMRSGSLLRDYRQQQQQQNLQQHSPTLKPQASGTPSYLPPPSAPQQEQSPQQQGWPLPQSWPSAKKQQGQGWLSNTVDVVRRWSAGRMAAMPPVDQRPLVLYRPSSPPPPLKSKPWKRSRALRIAMHMRHRRERWKQSRPRVATIVSSVIIAILLLLTVATSSATGYAYQYYQNQLPRLQGLANQQIEQTTRIYDRNGNLLYEAYDQQMHGGRRTAVSYKALPTVLQDAQIAAEDPTFWTNSGIDPQAILRAGSQYVQAGGVVSGASTMTQQLIKNMTNDTAVTLNRKISEAALAIGLTQQYPKWKIMEMYFNVSPYGAQNLGVESAVEDYFHLSEQCDKNFNCIPAVSFLNCDSAHMLQCLNCDSAHISQCDPAHCASKYCDPLLGLARAALLAGMPQDPPTYDPTFGSIDPNTGQKYYLERQQYVFSQMLKLGMQAQGLGTITQDMVSQAEAMTARMKFPPYNHAYYHGSQHFVQWVISQLEAQLGTATFLTGGFNVRTTIDTNVEAYVERAVHRHLDLPEVQYFGKGDGPLNTVNDVNDAAVIVMAAKTGEVLAMDGSANYNSQDPRVSGNINMAVRPRPPGSTIKPIVYTSAFEQGWYPGMVIPDRKTYFPTGNYGRPVVCSTDTNPGNTYCPVDYGGGYTNSNVTIRSAIADSRNIPAIRASLFAGLGNVIHMGQRLGITALSDKTDNNVSFALGTSAIPLIQMVQAYQVFADQGIRIAPKYVLDIWDNYGHHLYHFDPANPGGIQIISQQVAFMMTSILSDEYARQAEFWPDHDLSFWTPYTNQPDPLYPDVAAKTGTTDSFKDNLTIGYTSSVVVGVWAGNANDEAMKNVIGITGAAPIWHSVMTYMSGMCDYSYDSVPCGKMDLTFPPQTFTPPQGVVRACVSAANGLAGNGSCDWMLASDVPQQSGMTSTNNNPTPTPTP